MASDYRAAIESTEGVIRRRGTWFRNQVIAVVLIAAAAGIAAAALGWPALLTGALLLVPACGLFVVIDAALLRRWRDEVIGAWVARRIDVAALRAAALAHPRLPPGTLQAMLATLPDAGDLATEQAMGPAAREALAARVLAGQQVTFDRLVAKVVVSAAVVGLLLAAIWACVWLLALSLALPALVPLSRLSRVAATP